MFDCLDQNLYHRHLNFSGARVYNTLNEFLTQLTVTVDQAFFVVSFFSTTYPVTMLPPSYSGASQVRVTDSLVTSFAVNFCGAEGLSRTTTLTVAVFDPALFSSVSEYFPALFLKINILDQNMVQQRIKNRQIKKNNSNT